MLLGILLAIHIIVCVCLIGVVLLQRSEGGALGMGGGPNGMMTARGAGDLLTRTTWILGTLFFILSLALTLLTGRQSGSGSVVDRIKIDKSIISKVLSNPAELAIVQGTLLVARGLSADVTAEGVESQDEVSILKLAGCTELQGYYFHKPMPAAEITSLLAKRREREAERKRA